MPEAWASWRRAGSMAPPAFPRSPVCPEVNPYPVHARSKPAAVKSRPMTPLRIFICYARSDNVSPHHWLDRVKKQLQAVRHAVLVEVDSDTEIRTGQKWHDFIQAKLDGTDVAVLLVSADFLASRYVREHELPRVLKDFHSRGLHILPVLLSPFGRDGMLLRYPDPQIGPEDFDLTSLQAIGTPDLTLEEMDGAKQKRALADLADEVSRIARERRTVVAPQEHNIAFVRGVLIPAWANNGFGHDDYGVWAEFQVDGVVQRCRWIKPGTFLMGSPENEAGRSPNEGPQHEVTLSGYWLADTACPQALWLAVMRSNPSRFQGDPRLPVEEVNRDDCLAFLEKLNRRVPGLSAGFPSEAQWEYACRAGTTTPFSFGTNIPLGQVNGDRSEPSAGAPGWYRGKTVPVASLPPNPWGLFEMHGNVWELCSDRIGHYAAEPQTDPEGPSEGNAHVMRGASFIGNDRNARSACRSNICVRGDGMGFGLRIAPGRAGVEPA